MIANILSTRVDDPPFSSLLFVQVGFAVDIAISIIEIIMVHKEAEEDEGDNNTLELMIDGLKNGALYLDLWVFQLFAWCGFLVWRQ